MKKLVQINVVCNGSTGRIMCDIAKEASKNGFDSYCFFGRGEANKELNCIKIDNKLEFYMHALITRIFNKHGHGSYFATKRMIKKLKKINPDVIHMHNVHGYYLNLQLFFNYLKNDYKGKTVWTLHDCWAFTGHCSHFTVAKCNKWKNGCSNCPQAKEYPKGLFFDTSKVEYNLKRRLFTGINNLTLVTPSKWLSILVKKSFLKEYDVCVINNGIDLNVFKPTYDETIYEKYNIPKDKKIILGVANIWSENKGLKDFIELAKVIDEKFIIVLVGKISENIKQKNIIQIGRTDNTVELAKLYTISWLFFNPTYEDNYPTTNLEAIACNKKIIAYDVGGNSEIIKDGNGIIVEHEDFKKIIDYLNYLKVDKSSKYEPLFNKTISYNKYFSYYKKEK